MRERMRRGSMRPALGANEEPDASRRKLLEVLHPAFPSVPTRTHRQLAANCQISYSMNAEVAARPRPVLRCPHDAPPPPLGAQPPLLGADALPGRARSGLQARGH